MSNDKLTSNPYSNTTRKREWHGWGSTRLHSTWMTMKRRCLDPRFSGYFKYGGRGISVCEEWQASFIAFKDWSLANGYNDNLTLDRKDSKGNYSPANCRWSTAQEQARNTRRNVWITAFGETKLLIDWVADSRCQVTITCVQQRLHRGWSPEEAIGKKPFIKQQAILTGLRAMKSLPIPALGPDEAWKPIPEWEAYEVSDAGRIRSSKSGQWKIVAGFFDKRGRAYVDLGDGKSGRKRFAVARLVLMAFVGRPPEKDFHACHFPDPNPANNHLLNLRWDSKSENQRDRTRVNLLAVSMI